MESARPTKLRQVVTNKQFEITRENERNDFALDHCFTAIFALLTTKLPTHLLRPLPASLSDPLHYYALNSLPFRSAPRLSSTPSNDTYRQGRKEFR